MMNPIRRQRLFLVIFIVVAASLAVGLMTYALRDNINLFYPPSDIAAGEAPPGVRFLVTDGEAEVEVHYTGILPDLFAAGEAAVVTGELNKQGIFMASEVLAKHDENYTPPEVADAMNAAHERAQQSADES